MVKKAKILLIVFMISFFNTNVSGNYENLAYDFEFKNLNGGVLSLSKFKNKIIIIVNVASKCGFTNQYKDLQKVWEKYNKKGIVVLGIPSNDFGKQEPGSSEEIKDFCVANFGITFPMTEKVTVKGDLAHPFYLWAKKNHGKSAIPKWNFHKIIIGKDGKVFETFTSITNLTSKKFISILDNLIES